MIQPTPEAVRRALADPASSPLADRVAEAIGRYQRCFADAVDAADGFEKDIILPAPQDAVEQVAFQLFLETLRAELPTANVIVRATPRTP